MRRERAKRLYKSLSYDEVTENGSRFIVNLSCSLGDVPIFVREFLEIAKKHSNVQFFEGMCDAKYVDELKKLLGDKFRVVWIREIDKGKGEKEEVALCQYSM